MNIHELAEITLEDERRLKIQALAKEDTETRLKLMSKFLPVEQASIGLCSFSHIAHFYAKGSDRLVKAALLNLPGANGVYAITADADTSFTLWQQVKLDSYNYVETLYTKGRLFQALAKRCK